MPEAAYTVSQIATAFKRTFIGRLQVDFSDQTAVDAAFQEFLSHLQGQGDDVTWPPAPRHQR